MNCRDSQRSAGRGGAFYWCGAHVPRGTRLDVLIAVLSCVRNELLNSVKQGGPEQWELVAEAGPTTGKHPFGYQPFAFELAQR
jgi:hypothetical protein